MVAAVPILILVALFFGLGFVVKALFWVALALLVVWLLGWLVGAAGRSEPRRRWYYW